MQWGCRLLKIWENLLRRVMGIFKYRKNHKKIELIKQIRLLWIN